MADLQLSYKSITDSLRSLLSHQEWPRFDAWQPRYPVLDLLMIFLTLAFFALALLYVQACEKLR